ncbi:hypothetical protein A1O3_10084 [Capronia epimyces CBS 606.96]|uniref:Uncharacterized protein n=1 Tax=Capronia epimyces CBS 606.96 TaxID=1182542 RepID=W9X8Y9_9EURO|nr:uncharacterized protein A1O3_10084 [Capronia epimyces CBS 606.96]EXJ76927.1 hypothetical protein A1O3_10084 [Capronia epimyces CBS 606.96]
MGTTLTTESAPELPPGYEWMEDVIAREQQAQDNPPLPSYPWESRGLVTIGRTLVFKMPKDDDWDKLDKENKMARKREYLCQRYNEINLSFEEDPPNVRNKRGPIQVPKNDYYALFEVWDSPNAEPQYHISMTLLEHGLGLLNDEFKKLHQDLVRAALQHIEAAEKAAKEAAEEEAKRRALLNRPVGNDEADNKKADKKKINKKTDNKEDKPKKSSSRAPRGPAKRKRATKPSNSTAK